MFADFVPAADGENRILGADLAVAGDFTPAPLPAGSRDREVDGYTVTLDGELTAGAESELTLSVSRDGRPVTDLQPYLGAYGHLVALRSGDLAYLHVHPADDGDAGPRPIRFFTTAPSAGTYRLFLDFKHGDVVRTAAFTVSRRARGGPMTTTASGPGEVELLIGGMTCASCAARVEKKLNRIDGVTATVNYATEKAKVRFADGVTTDDLIATVEKTGYTAALPAAAAGGGAGPADGPRAVAAHPAAGLHRADRARSSPWRWSRRCSSSTGSGCR